MSVNKFVNYVMNNVLDINDFQLQNSTSSRNSTGFQHDFNIIISKTVSLGNVNICLCIYDVSIIQSEESEYYMYSFDSQLRIQHMNECGGCSISGQWQSIANKTDFNQKAV